MSTATSIQWTDATWNPLRGCTPVSPGCLNCYAMKQARRFSGPGKPYEGLTKLTTKGPRWTGTIRLVPEVLEEPLHWRKPRRVFVNSMSDLFHENVPDQFIDRVFSVMSLCPQHVFQVLTKRPERMAAYCNARLLGLPLSNVWLGTSVEDQERADDRIPHLLRTPAAVRFLSCEPLLGPIDFRRVPGFNRVNLSLANWWVIVGGESGPGARPFNIAWAESLIEQCRAAGVACFVKQIGAKPYLQREVNGGVFTDPTIRMKDRKGGDISEWPDNLRVREFPA